MEYTIDKDGRKIATDLNISESYDVFVNNDGEFLGTVSTREEAEALRDNSGYPKDQVWIWDNRINN